MRQSRCELYKHTSCSCYVYMYIHVCAHSTCSVLLNGFIFNVLDCLQNRKENGKLLCINCGWLGQVQSSNSIVIKCTTCTYMHECVFDFGLRSKCTFSMLQLQTIRSLISVTLLVSDSISSDFEVFSIMYTFLTLLCTCTFTYIYSYMYNYVHVQGMSSFK